MTSATIRRTLMICALALGLVIVRRPGVRADAGRSRARSSIAQGNPVDGAKILLLQPTRRNRDIETKTQQEG